MVMSQKYERYTAPVEWFVFGNHLKLVRKKCISGYTIITYTEEGKKKLIGKNRNAVYINNYAWYQCIQSFTDLQNLQS